MTFSSLQRTDVNLFHCAESYTVSVGRESSFESYAVVRGRDFSKGEKEENSTDALQYT